MAVCRLDHCGNRFSATSRRSDWFIDPGIVHVGRLCGDGGHFYAAVRVYLLLLSVFINISTLEKRVKSLSQVAINAKEMEREMVLGQAVPASFLRMPETPAGMGVVCHHEPAVYVSGDIYYVHWDGKREILTMLLSDIAGHGVQAALKAAVCLTFGRVVVDRGRSAPG